MNKQEQILSFFDEELSISEEKELFTSLASDENFRNDFKNHYKMEKSIYENMNSFNPTANQSAGIFSGLGISAIPSNEPNAGNISWLNYFLVGAGSALTTVIIMLMLFNSGSDQNIAGNIKNSYPLIIRDTILKHQAPEKIHIKQETEIVDKQKENPGSNIIEKNIQPIYYSSAVAKNTSNKDHNKIDLRNNTFNQTGIKTNDYNSLILQDLNKKNDLGLSVELFTSTYWFYPEHRVPPVKYSNLNRLGAAVYYCLTEDLSLGMDIRRETFEVSYRGMEDGQYFNYYQQPNLTTVGLNVRYDLLEYCGFDFFAKMNAGWNLYGYLFRPAVGMKYFISENVYLLLDLEYSKMMFNHQNNYYNAEKYGFNYGINVRF